MNTYPTSPEEAPGMSASTSESLLSYSIYFLGIFISQINPEEVLVFLSILAVCLRIPVDARKVYYQVKTCFVRSRGKGEGK